MKGPIRSLEVTYLLHATEDPSKVSDAVAKVLSVGAPGEVEDLEGHFGNCIERVRIHLTGDDAQGAFEKMVSGLSTEQRSELMGNLGNFLDEHSALFIRFDKQHMVSGSLSLESTDPVRVKVKPRPFLMGGDAKRFYSDLLER